VTEQHDLVLQQLRRPRGLPKYAEVVQGIVCCGLDCGLEKPMNSVQSTFSFPRNSFIGRDHSEAAVWKTALTKNEPSCLVVKRRLAPHRSMNEP